MADFTKTCDRGCHGQITMSQRSGKWGAYDQDGSYHDCQKVQEKNDHGNELVQPKDMNVQITTTTTNNEPTKNYITKRKLVLRKWFTSNNPDVLTIAVNDFVKEKEGRAGQTYAVWRPDIASMEYGECVYYEAEV